jgi:hypothetical protein
MGNPESKYLKTQAKVIVYRDGKMFSFADITDTSEEFVASKVQSIINWYEYPVQKDFVSSRYD